ncbi:hypothetical protein [Haloarcula sp. 1CSR25-25]|jgi:hypothetical protein|uniref:hypothetical protein n=1 Tax=Haloarcula sp. 1CSR25-25 TaxID=2862545 RepID=UPI00289543EA|nr:hypothetical protein [Haloarcula sp. 1CSR25-25]MDT3437628.1 hypothetical protein [Haloarcula sp. 1CSR25-25]
MTDVVEEDCPVCNSSEDAKAQFARAKVAEHLKEKARRDEAHRAWVDEYTTNGTLAEIREALDEQGHPRN